MATNELIDRADYLATWRTSERAQIGSLASGTKFRSITGELWSVVRDHGASGLAVICQREDGSHDVFARNAEVVPCRTRKVNDGENY